MNPVIRETYESYYMELSKPLRGELSKKMEHIRKDLLELPEGIQDVALIKAYRERIPEVCVILEDYSINFTAFFATLPEVPKGLEVFSSITHNVKPDKRTFFSLSAAFGECLKNKDFELAFAINQQQKPKQRELHLRELIQSQFSFDETTEAIPEEFKRLYHLLGKDQYILIWETAYPEGADGPILKNPKILRELADITDRETLKQLLVAKSIEMEHPLWCSLF